VSVSPIVRCIIKCDPAFPLWRATESRWNRNMVSLIIIIILLLLLLLQC